MVEIDFPTFSEAVRAAYSGSDNDNKRAIFKEIDSLCRQPPGHSRARLTDEAIENAQLNSANALRPFSWARTRKGEESNTPPEKIIDDFKKGKGSPLKAAVFHFLFHCDEKYREHAARMDEVIGLTQIAKRPTSEWVFNLKTKAATPPHIDINAAASEKPRYQALIRANVLGNSQTPHFNREDVGIIDHPPFSWEVLLSQYGQFQNIDILLRPDERHNMINFVEDEPIADQIIPVGRQYRLHVSNDLSGRVVGLWRKQNDWYPLRLTYEYWHADVLGAFYAPHHSRRNKPYFVNTQEDSGTTIKYAFVVSKPSFSKEILLLTSSERPYSVDALNSFSGEIINQRVDDFRVYLVNVSFL